MGTFFIVKVPPCFYFPHCFGHGLECFLIQAFAAQEAVKRFHMAIMERLALGNGFVINPEATEQRLKNMRLKLRTVIPSNQLGHSMFHQELLEVIRNDCAGHMAAKGKREGIAVDVACTPVEQDDRAGDTNSSKLKF